MKDNKIVCSCVNITVKRLKDAVKNGARSFEEVQAVTKVSTSCGKCRDHAKAIVEELIVLEKNGEL